MSLKQRLAEHLRPFEAAPFLFVGSGLSRRYVGLDTWRGLLERFAIDLDRPFEYYFSRAAGDLPTVARLIAVDFHEMWWQADRFADHRVSFKSAVTAEDSPLKIEIAGHIATHKHTHGTDPNVDKEIAVLKKAVIDGVITTNWDFFLESAFPDYRVFIGQDAILFSNPQGIAEIYKIHGCASDPNSLVLTDADYGTFEQRNPYLAAKLLTIFVEHPVIFFGYSLSDPNILKLLNSLAACLSAANIGKLKDRLIFVQWDPVEEREGFESTIIPSVHGSLPVTIIRTGTFLPVFEALSLGKRKYPARILRRIKEDIYELVMKNDPREQMYVLDIEEETADSKVEIVYGVGVKDRVGEMGYTVVGSTDLFQDVMLDEHEFDAERIVQDTLPRLVKNAKYVPIFKYLCRAGHISAEGVTRQDELDTRLKRAALLGRRRLSPPQQYRKKQDEVLAEYPDIRSVVSNTDPKHSIIPILLMPDERIGLADLKTFILANMNLLKSDNGFTHTYFRSVICLYDWLKYGCHAASAPSD